MYEAIFDIRDSFPSQSNVYNVIPPQTLAGREVPSMLITMAIFWFGDNNLLSWFSFQSCTSNNQYSSIEPSAFSITYQGGLWGLGKHFIWKR